MTAIDESQQAPAVVPPEEGEIEEGLPNEDQPNPGDPGPELPEPRMPLDPLADARIPHEDNPPRGV